MEHQELTARFDGINERLEKAAARSGRARDAVGLVAVSKWHPGGSVAALAAHWAGVHGAGRPVFGESYVQEALVKMPEVASFVPGLALEWHFVGHLQSNKAKDVASRFSLVHSVDSVKLASALQRGWHNRARSMPGKLDEPGPGPQRILIQVNIGREPQKSGIMPEDAEALLVSLLPMTELSVEGLMCLPPDLEDAEKARPFFAELRRLRDILQQRLGRALPHLSMGMSHDFEAAVEEGATLVRIGTDIFGSRG